MRLSTTRGLSNVIKGNKLQECASIMLDLASNNTVLFVLTDTRLILFHILCM